MMLFMVQGAAYAMDDQGGEKFKQIKSDTLEKVKAKRSTLNDFENCVQSSTSAEKIKSCKQDMREAMNDLKAKGKSMDEDREEASTDFQKERETRFKLNKNK